ncbi:MAG TPA: signal peptidase II [Thermoanaerobaculia bacterium]
MKLGPALAGKRAFLLLALAVLALDQWTKWLVERSFAPHSSHEIVPGLFHLSHVRNTGVAFGLFASGGDGLATAALAALGLGALAFVSWFFLRTPAAESRLLSALALVLGGAVGNLLDRLASGAVTDFLGVFIGSYRWPDFNVADSAICVGLGLMVLDSYLQRPEPDASET